MPDLRKACDLIRVGPLLHEKLMVHRSMWIHYRLVLLPVVEPELVGI